MYNHKNTFLTECLISFGMSYFRQAFYKVSDYIASKASNSPYKFLPHTFLFGAAIEFFMIKAPLAGKGETFYDVARRKESEKRWKVLHRSLPQEVITEEEIKGTPVETAEEVQSSLLESPIETKESSSKTLIETKEASSETPIEVQSSSIKAQVEIQGQ